MRAIAYPSPEELLPIYQELLPAPLVRVWVAASQVKLYWRLLTPLVILWGLMFQRLNSDHQCDAVVSHLHTGAADGLVPIHPQAGPLSKRLTSESTSSYVQGRNRLPLSVIQAALRHVSTVTLGWMREQKVVTTWKGHAVRQLDGTTFRLWPTDAILKAYTQASNQLGKAYWVTVRSVAAFCGFSGAAVGYAEAPTTVSEAALVRQVMEQDPELNSIYGCDRNFGTFWVFQVARACHKHVVARLNVRTAQALYRFLKRRGAMRSGADYPMEWELKPRVCYDPTLPTTPITGRLIYVRLKRKGFRPIDLCLFTTLLDAQRYSVEDLVALYATRWEAEINYRHLKTTLHMDEFDVKSPEMFRKELAAGLLTYNLICALRAQAALKARLAPTRLSFSQCYRRVRDLLTKGVPAWVIEEGCLEEYVLDRLAKCILPEQPHKIAYEPRQVRRRPAIFPALKGRREDARRKNLQRIAGKGKS